MCILAEIITKEMVQGDGRWAEEEEVKKKSLSGETRLRLANVWVSPGSATCSARRCWALDDSSSRSAATFKSPRGSLCDAVPAGSLMNFFPVKIRAFDH